MYNQEKNKCLIKQALEVYIKNHTPFEMKHPTEEELNRLTELLKETSVRHPNLDMKHDYDEYGVDWYPHGPNDIDP